MESQHIVIVASIAIHGSVIAYTFVLIVHLNSH
ncbi:hypothetical protein FHW17_005100 [Phyllobacterium sp. P30BS-XVII]|nr:hypothetical protein [Phyllobacterium sp. P30BS-XVII]